MLSQFNSASDDALEELLAHALGPKLDQALRDLRKSVADYDFKAASREREATIDRFGMTL